MSSGKVEAMITISSLDRQFVTQQTWGEFFEADSEQQRDRFALVVAYERRSVP
jgi:hypothetical protein